MTTDPNNPGGSGGGDGRGPLDLDGPIGPPPAIPPPRTFMVLLNAPTASDALRTESQIVEAHQVEITSNGDLLFFVFTFAVTPAGYHPNSLLRRAFAKGIWRDAVETMIPAISKGLVH